MFPIYHYWISCITVKVLKAPKCTCRQLDYFWQELIKETVIRYRWGYFWKLCEKLIIISTKQPTSFPFIATLIVMRHSWITVLSVIEMDNPCCDGNAILTPFPVIPLSLSVLDKIGSWPMFMEDNKQIKREEWYMSKGKNLKKPLATIERFVIWKNDKTVWG